MRRKEAPVTSAEIRGSSGRKKASPIPIFTGGERNVLEKEVTQVRAE